MYIFLADVRVYSFTLILSVDYLLKIAEFFTTSLAEAQPDIQKSKSVTSTSSRSVTSASKTSAAPSDKESTMTLNLRIEKPDIILVEHMDNIDTNALILNVCF